MNEPLIIGGVPEHFNLPWHLAIENQHFEKKGVAVEWKTFHGGTGEMSKALRSGDADICVILTEGIVADIVLGNPSKVIGQFINSPLIWGIHTAKNNTLNAYNDIFDQTYAISRFGSGSHLMPIVDANSKSRVLKDSQFAVVKNLNGALVSLAAMKSDVFYWEKFMTKPYVDGGKLKRIGEFSSPWASFVLAARNEVIENHADALKSILEVIHFNNDQFVKSPFSIDEVAQRYKLDVEDVETWFHLTEWNTGQVIRPKMIENVLYSLKSAGIINKTTEVDNIITEL